MSSGRVTLRILSKAILGRAFVVPASSLLFWIILSDCTIGTASRVEWLGWIKLGLDSAALYVASTPPVTGGCVYLYSSRLGHRCQGSKSVYLVALDSLWQRLRDSRTRHGDYLRRLLAKADV